MGNRLISGEAIEFVRKTLNLSEATPLETTPLGKRGSDRAFFRLAWGTGDSVVLVDYDPKRQENCYHAEIGRFLREIGVPAPLVIGHDPLNHITLMEDLGEIDLWSLRNVEEDTRKNLYQQTVAAMERLHAFPEKSFPTARVRLMSPFDAGLYRWERDYFREYFVKTVCLLELDRGVADSLEAELSGLAERLMAGPRCLVHRDLQSQNVMIKEGKPVFIDFQGMRFGSPFYDLGSFLCDPYMEFNEEERNSHLSLYYDLSGWGCNRGTFEDHFWEASTQRLMQALGAYGFLGLSKGLATFLDHIPAGLHNLEVAAGHVSTLSTLRDLLQRCRTAWMARADRREGADA